MEIDFIKWMCEKADGFRIENDRLLITPNNSCYALRYDKEWIDINCDTFKAVYYPLLLQRAVEGINNIKGKFHIVINAETVFIMIDDSLDPINHRYFDYAVPPNKDPIDTAKESALKYIYDQEKKDLTTKQS